MEKPPYKAIGRPGERRLVYTGICVAVFFYAVLGWYLYRPYLKDFEPVQYFVVLNSVIGAVGCFVLSRRWVGAIAGSVLAGAVYGYSPFALGFAAYHPLAGVVLAAVPWLFCPAAFLPRRLGVNKTLRITAVTAGLSLLPFIVMAVLFWLLAQHSMGPFFPLPKNEKLHLANLAGLVALGRLKPENFIFSLYHVPLAAGVMGLFMYFSARRIGVSIIVLVAFCLAFSDSVFQVSPIVWALIPMLCLSILAGLGMEGLTWCGRADRRWVLVCVFLMAALAIITYLLGLKLAGQYHQAAKMHATAAVLMGVMFFMAKAQLRWHLFRWVLLYMGAGVDILLGARHIVDKIF